MKNIDTTTVGGRIKKLRMDRGLSQEQLAERIYSTTKCISAYENNRNGIDNHTMYSMAIVLGTTMEYIMTGDQNASDVFLAESLRKLKLITNPMLQKSVLKQLDAIIACQDEMEEDV